MASDTEIDEYGLASVTKHYVVWLDVSVHQLPLGEVLNRLRQRDRERSAFVDIECTPCEKPIRQRSPSQEFL